MAKEQNCNCGCCKGNNPYVSITGTIGGIYFIVAVMFLIFAPDRISYLVDILWGFVVLGIAACLFAVIASKKHCNCACTPKAEKVSSPAKVKKTKKKK